MVTINRLARRPLASVAAVLLAAAAPTPGPRDPVAAIQQARRQAEGGNHAGAARFLDAWLYRDERLISRADAAVVHLDAARHATDASDMASARRHLAKVEAADDAFANVPPAVLARVRREAARLHERLGEYVAAEHLLAQASDSLEAAATGGVEILEAVEAADALGTVRTELGRPGEAAAAFRRALALMRCKEAPSASCVVPLVNLVNISANQSDLETARDAAASAERAAGDDPDLRRTAALARARILIRDNDPAAAEAALASVANISAGRDEALRGFALFLTATSRFERGLLPEAAHAAMSADVAYRAALGDDHPARARVLHTLAMLNMELGDDDGAAMYFDHAEAITARAFGRQSFQVAFLALERVRLDLRLGDSARAMARVEAARAAASDHLLPNIEAGIRCAAALVAEYIGHYADAAADFAAARDLLDGHVQRSVSPEIGFALLHLARVQTELGRFEAAEATIDRTILVYERLGSSSATWKAEALAARADLLLRRGDRQGALRESRRAVAVLRDQVSTAGAGGGLVRQGAREVLAAHARRALDVLGPEAGLDEAFAAAQLAFTSRAGDAVRLAAARLAARDGPLADLLREREAVADRLRQGETLLRAALLRPGQEALAEESRLQESIRALQTSLQVPQTRLIADHPRFASYADSSPLRAAALRDALGPDEALLMPFAHEGGTLLFAFTRDAASAALVPLRRAEAGRLVGRLRAGLDIGRMQQAARVTPFDTDAAKALHRALIGPAAGMLAGKRRLVIIADGALQTFPPSVLLDPDTDEWLVRRFVLSSMPSPAAFVSARHAAQGRELPIEPDGAFLGVGDPQAPEGTAIQGGTPRDGASELRQAVLHLPSLPETRGELSHMAALYPPDRSQLLLGPDATRGRLIDARPVNFRVIAFATHAIMAGELPGLLEPAIVMTPENAGDSGFLFASEVAALDLDADLVVLSACNTAAPDGGPMGEGLSGLARAFLHAGARSLLVSHWAVNSLATARLTTDFLDGLHGNPGAGKAVALRNAMLAMLDGPDRKVRHPAFWAPFVLIGD